jgi:hypothetical protein
MQIFNKYFEATLSDIKHLIDKKDTRLYLIHEVKILGYLIAHVTQIFLSRNNK